MKLSRKEIRVLIESVINEGNKGKYYVPGRRDRPSSYTYTIDHDGNTVTLDTFDANSKIIVTFLDKKDSEGNPESKRYRNDGAKTDIPWPGGKHRIKVNSMQ